MNRRVVIAMVMILAFGAARMPFERRLELERKAAHFQTAQLNLGLREQIGQMAFVAALSGFRAVIADGLYLYAHSLWERVEWGRMKVQFDAVVTLQPHCILFWEQAAWHMWANASVAAFNDKNEPREALRIKAQQEYWRLGEDYLLRAIANNPEKANLYQTLGTFVYRDRFKDHCKAAEIFARGEKCPDAPVFLKRFTAYELAQCPGHEREAYERLRAYYQEGEDEHLPTLLKWLGILQEKLKIPPEQKIAIPPAPNP